MSISRRDFIVTSAALGAAGYASPFAIGSPNQPSKMLNIGLVGSGGRGSGAANDSLTANPNVRLVAMADVDLAKAKGARDGLKKAHGDRVSVDDARIYGGLDGFMKVINDPTVDLVILTTSPGFRPSHIKAAVEAKKHVFAEKPVCTDSAGYRTCCEAHDLALKQGTAIVTGTQYRRQPSFMEAIKNIKEKGMIGEPVSMTARYCAGEIWYRDRLPGQSDADYQIMNWMHFIWASGDQIVEQAVHNIDVVHWMFGTPRSAFAVGSRWHRPADSEMWDSFKVDFQFDGGRLCSFTGRHWPKATGDFDNVVYGSEGVAQIKAFSNGSIISDRNGKELWRMKGDIGGAYRREHKDLVDSIVAGKPIVELRQTAESSLMAVMGREAAYTGRTVGWDEITGAKLDLFPHDIAKGAVAKPFVRIPGQYELA